MKFGENLKKLRKSRKLSQEDLAEKVNVSRQSVSKWETGDAYPEMNNILELCKIFHCHINDLVNDSIIDINSLDEEIKMSVVKFKKEKQNKMKALSKAISIIARIGKVITLVCIPIVIVTMIITGIVINKVDYDDGQFKLNSDNKNIEIVESNEKMTLKMYDMVVADIDDSNMVLVTKAFENNSKFMIFTYVEVGFIFLVITLVLAYIMLKSLEKLFENINMGDTPFTLENVNYIKKIAYFMILITILPSLGGLIFELVLKTDLGVDFEMFNLIEILVLFSIAYIFEYGYEIQLDSKGKMYGDENE